MANVTEKQLSRVKAALSETKPKAIRELKSAAGGFAEAHACVKALLARGEAEKVACDFTDPATGLVYEGDGWGIVRADCGPQTGGIGDIVPARYIRWAC